MAGEIVDINGPLVRARLPGVVNGEQVRIGRLGLTGEVIGREGEEALIQVYETTDGLRPGDEVDALGRPLSVELGPGLLGRIFDGVQRPLDRLAEQSGAHIPLGAHIPSLDRDRKWTFTPAQQLKQGASVAGGTVLGTVQESETITHKILVPPGLSGKLQDLAANGGYPWRTPSRR